jgi:hypothetical protein
MSQNNYKELTRNLRSQLDPENLIIEKSIKDELSSISYSDVLEYVRYAMNAVEYTYTQRSKEAGENVKTHLANGGITGVTFKYQGSVMTDTHIRGYSDIDLLVISEKFYMHDYLNINRILSESSLQSNYYPSQLDKIRREADGGIYQGSILDDLRGLRENSENILRLKYLNFDDSKPKSIWVKNTNLRREVDTVIANWYDDITSIISDKGSNRGIQVYNKHLNAQGKVDFPFISIERINNRSSLTSGRLKKMIRFLKNIKAKSSLTITLSSFDFNAICYDIDPAHYQTKTFYQLVPVIYTQLNSIASNLSKANSLTSVDGREYIFANNAEKLQSLRNLMNEVNSIVSDLSLSRLY